MLFLIFGLWRVDTQLNDLAQWHDFPRIFNIKNDPKSEETVVYFLGESIPLDRIVPIKAEVGMNEVIINASSDHQISIPYRVWYGELAGAADRFIMEAKRYYAEFFP